ncbi:sulfurtransferase TusA family protein [Spirillospora sp. NPDC048911]|uniref:sulfurtransferase TusA family protein n=1 Tax=Spirillospora sp. NPDC048911 TaxID=3364527 RepID=UPI003720D23E
MRFRSRAKNGSRDGADSAAQQPAVPDEPPPALVIDALGRKCPIPIIMLAERLREVPVGDVIAVLADDVAARTDIPAWCRMKSQDFVREETLPHGGWGFHIRRTY